MEKISYHTWELYCVNELWNQLINAEAWTDLAYGNNAK